MGFLDKFLPGASAVTGIGTSIANTVGQYQQMNYMKEMQQESWRREDSAVQRRVADLGAAGLSPVLAAGSSASASSPITIGAPDHGDIQGNIRGAAEMVGLQKSIAKTEADTMKTNAEILKTQLASDKLDLQNKLLALEYDITNRDYSIIKGEQAGKLYKRNSGVVSEFLEVLNVIGDKFGYKGKVSIPGVYEEVKKVTGGTVVDSAKGPKATQHDKLADTLAQVIIDAGGDSTLAKMFGEYMAPLYAANPNMSDKEYQMNVTNFERYLRNSAE